MNTIGFVGLGRMGGNMALHLRERGIGVVAFDASESARKNAEQGSIQVEQSLAEVIAALPSPRIVWIMVQRDVVKNVFEELFVLLEPGDIIIDGGNSLYTDSQERAKIAEGKGISFMDCGVSGGVDAARNGACLMIGGSREAFESTEAIFNALAAPDAYAYLGKSGAGHFVKMVHNGIEYGMMQAIGEGSQVLFDNATQFGYSLNSVLSVYNHNSIVESALTKFLANALKNDAALDSIEGTVPTGDTEAEMNQLAHIGRMPALQLAIAERARSREEPSFAMKAVAAMRKEFGGHGVVPKESKNTGENIA